MIDNTLMPDSLANDLQVKLSQLKTCGILTEDLLHVIWSNEEVGKNNFDKAHKVVCQLTDDGHLVRWKKSTMYIVSPAIAWAGNPATQVKAAKFYYSFVTQASVQGVMTVQNFDKLYAKLNSNIKKYHGK